MPRQSCTQCRVSFDSPYALEEHYVQSPNHHYCRYCVEMKWSEEELHAHFRSAHHYCESCKIVANTARGLQEHFRQASAHQPRQQLIRSYRCELCGETFHTASNLREHLNSKKHRDRSVKCHFAACGRMFIKVSDLILHLESGSCPSGKNLADVDYAARQLSDHGMLIILSDFTNNDIGVSYRADPALAWNGYEYECGFCPALFHSINALNSHLASPKHRPYAYQCPGDRCNKKFKTLSAFFQHYETQTCSASENMRLQIGYGGLATGRLMLGY